MKRKTEQYMEDLKNADCCQNIKQLQNGFKIIYIGDTCIPLFFTVGRYFHILHKGIIKNANVYCFLFHNCV